MFTPYLSLSEARRIALIGEAFGQSARDQRRRFLVRVLPEIDVISIPLAGQQGMPAMMGVVIPLCGEVFRRDAVFGAFEPAHLVFVVLNDEMDDAIRLSGADRMGDFGQDMLGRSIVNRVDCVQPQAVEIKLFHPVYCVIHKERS